MSSEDASEASSSSSISSLEPADHVVILYASETGNSQDIAERTGREFRRLGRPCVVISMDMFDIFDLPHIPLLILITSTHGRGDPPPAMKPLWSALLRSSLPTNILEDVNFALYGLGDSSYEKFCYAGKMLARRMEGLSAVKLGEPAWGDERAPDGLEETFPPWLQQTVDLMLPLLPSPPEDFQPEPSTSIPPPVYDLTFDPRDYPALSSLSINPASNGTGNLSTAPTRAVDEAHGQASDMWKPDNWGWAKLTKNNRVTKPDWWQDVRDVELEVSEERLSHYLPGSICCLQPKNSPDDIHTFLTMSGLTALADEPFCIRSKISDQPLPPHLPPADTTTTLRCLLTNHLDLRASPQKSFFEWLRRFSPDETEQERLDDFITDPDEIHDYATRPSRTILEVLADFRHTRLPLSHLLEILPPLRRRQFSIASSSASHPGKIQLLIALVEYKTNLKIPRKGLCSTWLKDLAIGTRIPLAVEPPTMFLPSPEQYLILVGPGTGVAPMRALVEERIRQGAAEKTVLYFGCRSRSADLYYASDWERYSETGFRVRVAASRDQEEKVYVQNLIKDDAQMIREWLCEKRGSLFISGSSNSMPRQVREAIAWCISSEGFGPLPAEAATEFVEDMFEDGRGVEESW